MEIKQAVFAELDAVTPGHAILASNTSSLSITEIGDATLRPEKVVGFHYFYPASVMPLIEVVEGDDTAPETVDGRGQLRPGDPQEADHLRRGARVRRQPDPQLRHQRGLARPGGAGAVDQGDRRGGQHANVAPMGPFFLIDLLGLDTVLHVAEHLDESYGDRFYVHQGMKRLVAEGKLGAKTGGEGFYTNGEPNVEGDADRRPEQLAELLGLKAFVEACLVLEEGVATTRDIDLGMMAGAGLDPRRGLFAVHEGRPDRLWTSCSRSSSRPQEARRALRAADRSCGGSSPRAGSARRAGQGFYAYPRPDDELRAGPRSSRSRRAATSPSRGSPTRPLNSISPQVIRDLGAVWEHAKDGGVRALVIASANPLLFSAGADIKAFTQMDEAGGAELLDQAHALLRAIERSRDRDDRRGQRARLRRRLRAGDGLRRAHRRAVGPLRPARDQARDHPGLRRHAAAAAARRDEQGARDEPHRGRDPADEAYEFGLVNRVVPDHELLDTALLWARKLAGQAPLAVGGDQARLGARATSTRASRPRSRPSRGVRSRGRARGHLRVPRQAPADVEGR